MLRDANHKDIELLVRIHQKELSKDFLPSLGKNFLNQLYNNLLNEKNTTILVSTSNNEICGFIVGSSDFSRAFKNIILSNFFKYLWIIFPKVIKKPQLVLKVFETLFYTKKEADSPKAELVVISILKKYQRLGIGKTLVNSLEKTFKDKGIKKYKVSVNASNKSANLFYSFLGFKKYKSFFLYKKRINLLIKHI